MKKKLFTFLCALAFVLVISAFGVGQAAEAASKNAVESITVRIDNKRVTKKTYTLEIGKSKTLKVSALPETAVKQISYKSKNSKIATVNKNGKVTAKRAGTVRIEITVTGKDNEKKTTWVRIKSIYPTVKSVIAKIDGEDIAGKTYLLENGESKQLDISAAPKEAVTAITYKSENPEIAVVTSDGQITAKSAGTARITIMVANRDDRKKSVWVDITVSERELNSTQEEETSNILIAYFSLAENTENSTNVDATTSASVVVDNTGKYGTTEYIAHMIQQNIGGDLYQIRTKESYSKNFDAVVDRNHQEMQEGVLPDLVQSNLDISRYDTIFIGYPVWATDAPQAILSFLNQYDVSGKKVIPFCTHDGYGAGSSYRTIRNACPGAEVLSGIAIEAKNVSLSEKAVIDWLAGFELAKPTRKETAIKITIGNHVLDAVIYDTSLAEEIKNKFPLTVSMSGYGGREYYGGLSFTPSAVPSGQLNFENGDITYCKTNNTMAIFYTQNHPNLTMEVVPIGRVISDLSVFDHLDSREDITFSLTDAKPDNDTDKNRVLVAYFSATNTTKKLAESFAEGLKADLYEIVPEIPYTSNDLDWHDSSSRTTIEMNDVNARPKISGSLENIDQYDMIFLGYPIWWGEAPRIICTFLESYDFSGKTIIPFCTSGSSGIGSSAANLHSLTDGANWLSGRRFSSSTSQKDMVEWADSLNLDTLK